MIVQAADGSRLGKVRRVVSDSQGKVSALVMRAGSTEVTLPATTFSAAGTGKALTSTMSAGQIAQAAQAEGATAGSVN
jgi:hypothetical protein